MDASTAAVAVVAGADGADGAAPPAELMLSAWMTKKARGAIKKSRKRYFELYSDGSIRYFSAVDPDGKAVDEKGTIRIFVDTKFKVEAEVLVLSSLSKDGLKDREWILVTESAEVATEWSDKITAIQAGLAASNTTAEHRRAAESSKAAESGVLNKLAGKVAGSASQASMQMRSFGYGGSVKVSGSLSVITVSMSIEVEIEEGEGEILSERRKSVVTRPAAADDDDDDDDDEADAAAAAAAKVEEDVDPAVPDTPEKESRFKRQLGKAMKAAMMKVKVLAFHMRMSSLTGAIGIAVAMTFFGVGITLEFEITLASAITDVEFEDMKAREEAKKVK